jgi:hypothetical protein
MTRAIREYRELTGFDVGFKPAGGLKSAKDALSWLILMKEELGNQWLEPDLFRIGASSMLGDIERQLEHHVTGRYSSAVRHAIGMRRRRMNAVTEFLRTMDSGLARKPTIHVLTWTGQNTAGRVRPFIGGGSPRGTKGAYFVLSDPARGSAWRNGAQGLLSRIEGG